MCALHVSTYMRGMCTEILMLMSEGYQESCGYALCTRVYLHT